ncbi:MAG: N-acetylmuramoyl-L-alanine amidase [Rhodospirillales bacterium]|jgi:N-acetylmuramoyl-L-alanine amidase|nr:N-acetylmuramoyl-L-alanine amidase [Rhodospirillales bacterium]MBT4006198.1 N-acetylmuramoyl-L-alanine amidase [Rhodospirillales bacterium]MBT5075292.1 N-acetylmuramoyl-L-alanine amidase [Rhodospirillales bacterium]MBT5114379.1 N-acetylmuramoyl-L-alanine amidase [Rhodospirillales bacterium]MBT5672771.1 N-acetylmuramoyl-L-alanine amidase [Rhodospirillales bacterium]
MWKTTSAISVFLGAVLLLGCLAPVRAASAASTVSDIRVGAHAGRVRLVLESNQNLKVKTFALASPYRLVMDLPAVGWDLAKKKASARRAGFVAGFRYGQFSPSRARVVFDLKRSFVIAKQFTLSPRGGKGWRFVVDLKPVKASQFVKSASVAGVSPSKDHASLKPKRRRAPDRKKVVVIDPGHGGIDPGAIGLHGVYEKKITLAMARVLRRTLIARQYRVVMTRGRDTFVRLRGRIAVARRAKADLFISLHADSLKRRNVRGASVYTLSEKASDREAAGLAAKENKADLIAGVDLSGESSQVTNILIELAQRETMNLSARFARVLVSEMRKTTRFLRKSHRFAGFAVLKAPDVPSVLLEMGYLSNALDEAQLTRPRYRARLSKAIANGIDRYFAIRAKVQKK